MFPANISLLHIGRDKRRRLFCCRSDASDALSASSCGEEELISDLRNRLVALLQLCESLTKLKLSPTPKLIMWLKNQVRNRLKCFSVCSELFAKKEATATFHLLSFYLQPSRRYSDYQHERHVSVGRSHLKSSSVSLELTGGCVFSSV